MGRGPARRFCSAVMRAIDERELCEFARFEAPHSVTFVKDLPKLRPTFISLLFANLNQDRTYAGTLRPFAMRALNIAQRNHRFDRHRESAGSQ